MKKVKHFKLRAATAAIAACSLLAMPVQAAAPDNTQFPKKADVQTATAPVTKDSMPAPKEYVPETTDGSHIPATDQIFLMGRELNAGETITLPGGGTAALEKDENGILELILADAVLETPESERYAIITSASLTIAVKGDCTIKGSRTVGYTGQDPSAALILNEDRHQGGSLTLETSRALTLDPIAITNNCDLTIRLQPEGGLCFYYLSAESSFTNHGSLSIEVDDNEESMGSITCTTFQNYGTVTMEKAHAAEDTYDLYFENLIQADGQIQALDGLQTDTLQMTGGSINAKDTYIAITVRQNFEMTNGSIDAAGSYCGITCGSSSVSVPAKVSLSGGTIRASAQSDIGCGMEIENAELQITGGSYEFKGGRDYATAVSQARSASGLHLFGTNATIQNCKLAASGGIGIDFEAPLSENDNLTLEKGSDLQLNGLHAGLFIYGANLYLNGGTIEAEAADPQEPWAPIVAEELWVDDTTDEEKENSGHIILAEGMTLTGEAKNSTVQNRTVSMGDDAFSYTYYFEFFGNEDSTVELQTPESSIIHWAFKNVPQKMTITDSHTHTHTGEGEILKEATTKSEGLIRYYCDTCGAYYEEVIPKLPAPAPEDPKPENPDPKPESEKPAPAPDPDKGSAPTEPENETAPKTADPYQPVFWLFMCGICAAGIAVSRKRKHIL